MVQDRLPEKRALPTVQRARREPSQPAWACDRVPSKAPYSLRSPTPPFVIRLRPILPRRKANCKARAPQPYHERKPTEKRAHFIQSKLPRAELEELLGSGLIIEGQPNRTGPLDRFWKPPRPSAPLNPTVYLMTGTSLVPTTAVLSLVGIRRWRGAAMVGWRAQWWDGGVAEAMPMAIGFWASFLITRLGKDHPLPWARLVPILGFQQSY